LIFNRSYEYAEKDAAESSTVFHSGSIEPHEWNCAVEQIVDTVTNLSTNYSQ